MMFWSVGKEGRVFQLRIWNQHRLPGLDTEGLCCHSLCQIYTQGIILSKVWLVRPALSYLRGSLNGGGKRERHWEEVPCE